MLVYTMTAAEREVWILGGPAQVHIETQIAEYVLALTTEDVLVRFDDGRFAYRLEQGR